jgi:hypothetical protein
VDELGMIRNYKTENSSDKPEEGVRYQKERID